MTEQGPFEIGETEVVELASEVDGTVIQIGVVRPDAPEAYRSPVIADAGPYFSSDLRDVDLTTCSPFLLENFVSHGYTIAFIPTRGAGGNDNCANLMGAKERADLDQAVTWLGTQPWSNGNVGMIGISYDGSTPWAVAAEGNPHLKTIVPASGVHNLFDLVYHRGRNDGRWWFFVPGYYHYYGLGVDHARCSGATRTATPARSRLRRHGRRHGGHGRELPHRRVRQPRLLGRAQHGPATSSSATEAPCCSCRACRTGTSTPATSTRSSTSSRSAGCTSSTCSASGATPGRTGPWEPAPTGPTSSCGGGTAG